MARFPSLSALRAFEAAARHLSFTKAAAEVCITQGAISYQIRSLEHELGVSLFRRERRSVVLTSEGRRLLPALQRGFAEIEAGIVSLAAQKEKRQLTITLSTYFATHWLSRRLGAFWQANPKTQLRFQHPETPVSLERGEVDLGIFWKPVGWTAAQGFNAELLFEAPLSPVCSPTIQQSRGLLTRPEQLRKHVLLRDEITAAAWGEWLRLANVDHPEAMNEMTINDPNVYIQAAIDGQGVALADSLIVDEISLNRLAKPFSLELPGYGYFIVYRKETIRRTPAREFYEWLTAQGKAFQLRESRAKIPARTPSRRRGPRD
jgi:LysR family glycine cleavage system transcriptional activator